MYIRKAEFAGSFYPATKEDLLKSIESSFSRAKKIETGKKVKEFEYKDLGSMATIGTNKAVVDLPFVRFKGYIAWLVWMFLHLMLILSVKNKLIIFVNWAWAYITKDTSLRLILTAQDDRKA